MKRITVKNVLFLLTITFIQCLSPNFSVSAIDGEIQPMYGESHKVTIVKSENIKKTVEVPGQAQWFCLNRGDMIYVRTGVNRTSVSLGTSWGPVSYSVNLGSASINAGGVGLRIPSKGCWKAYYSFNTTVVRKKVEEYKYNNLVRTYYVNDVSMNDQGYYFVRKR